jgi:hypothetical protein
MNCSEYLVVEVAVGDLPAGTAWVLMDEADRVTFAYIRDLMTADEMAAGWAAYRKVMRERTPPPLAELDWESDRMHQERWLRAV